jgi:CRP-like cAMP-binding protein
MVPRAGAREDRVVSSAVDVWAELAGRLDPGGFRPELGAWVETRAFEARGGRDYVMVANSRDLVYYRLEPAEAALLPLMDGTRTAAELLVARLRDSGELDFAAVVDVIRSLHAGGFLTESYVDVDAAVARSLAPTGLRARFAKFTKTLTIQWSGAERLTVWLHRHGLRYMFSRVGTIAGALVAVGGLVAFGAVAAQDRFKFTPQSVGFGFLILFTLNMLLIFVHELGHAALLVHYGRRVKGSGIRIYFGSPAFFIDSSDVLMLPRGQRIAQSFAGPYFELVATGAAAIALWAWPLGGVAPVLYRFVVLNYFVLLLNLAPMLELDGYWILADALRVPDLRPRSLTFMRHDLWAKLRHRERFSASEVGIGLYGTVGVLFTIFCLVSAGFFWRRTFGGLVTKMWNGGPIGVALLAILAAILGGPLLRAAVELVRSAAGAIAGLWRRVSFRAQRRWRVEAASLLDTLPIFDDLAVDVLNDIAGRVTLRRAGRETTIIRAGERADAFYVVRSGRLEVVETDPDTQRERVLHTVDAGASFGELGLATGAVRNATVRAVTDVELFVIDKGSFDRLLADRIRLPEIAPTLHALTELRALPPFAGLGTDELAALRDHGAWRNLAPGETVIAEGEVGDAFYAVGSGRLEVLQNGESIGKLGPGDYFGEIALLTDAPRTATVRASTPVRVFRLERAQFDSLLAGAFRRGRLATTRPVAFVRE